MSDRDNLEDLRLRSIADLLSIPVERFFHAEATPRPADTDECLRLWLGLRTAIGRAAALDALRVIADRECD